MRVLLPLVWLVEVPITRPEASRMTERTVPLPLFWWSMVCVTRPEASRTTSRQVSAVVRADSVNEMARVRRSGFMGIETDSDGETFDRTAA